MLALRLPPDIDRRLDGLAKLTGRTKSFYAREAILRHLEDMEDIFVAEQRLAKATKWVSLEDAKAQLGLETSHRAKGSKRTRRA